MDAAIVDQVAQLDESWRARLTQVEDLKAERNAVSKEIGAIKDKTCPRPEDRGNAHSR